VPAVLFGAQRVGLRGVPGLVSSPWLVQGFCAMQQGVYSMMGLSRASRPTGIPGGYVQTISSHGMIAGEHRHVGPELPTTWVEVRGTKATISYSRVLKKRLSWARRASWCRRTVSQLTDAT